MFRFRRYRVTTGFTIVELIVVIAVVAILATLVIVAYNGISGRASQAVLRNDLSQTLRLLQNFRTINNDFPASLDSLQNGGSVSRDTVYEYSATASTFCITASSVSANHSYYATESGYIAEGTCSGHYGLSPPLVADSEKLSVGYYHACTLAYNSTMYCWGDGSDGKLGNNSTSGSYVPIAVDTSGALAGKTITSISTSQYHTCAVASGAAYCWGGQMACQLGIDGCSGFSAGNPDVLLPTAVSTSGTLSGKTVTDISAGQNHTCAIASGEVFCWGQTQYGKLGGNTGTTGSTGTSLPVNASAGSILAGKTVTDIEVNYLSSCVIADGAVYCWGVDQFGQLGNGTDDSGIEYGLYSSVPVAVDTSGVLAGKTVTDISMGSLDTSVCAIADGGVYCWGDGNSGQLGNGLSTLSESPVAVTTTGVLSGRSMTYVTVSDYEYACAIGSGLVSCWGSNAYGQLGDGTTTNQPTPVDVIASGVLAGESLVSVEAGYQFSCALSSSVKIFCWGQTNRLGHGSSAVGYTTSPVLVTAP